MPLLRNDHYTSEDYWNLPEEERAELINGKFYDMAPPSRIHQKLVMELSATIREYIEKNHGSCEVYPAPFAVNLDADDQDWVEPDVSVICDPNKLTDRGCSGAPDLIFEIVSPASRKMDYGLKRHGFCIVSRSTPIIMPERKCRCPGILDRGSCQRKNHRVPLRR